jgi:uncharacterized membrane protein (UPF0127 family)
VEGKLQNAKTGEVIYERLVVADTFWKRAIGLLWRTELSDDEAILIRSCRSIHTCFMRMSIGAAFCDSKGRVLRVFQTVPPWRIRLGPKGSRMVVEFASSSRKLRKGQQLKIVQGG